LSRGATCAYFIFVRSLYVNSEKNELVGQSAVSDGFGHRQCSKTAILCPQNLSGKLM